MDTRTSLRPTDEQHRDISMAGLFKVEIESVDTSLQANVSEPIAGSGQYKVWICCVSTNISL